jgi:hypothetical protein
MKYNAPELLSSLKRKIDQVDLLSTAKARRF